MNMEIHGKELKVSGWYLSEEGITHCAEQCKEKGWTITTSNLKKAALDADLRLIGSGVLSNDISRNLTSEVSGPIVLQIQKIKNVAVPSIKQHNPSPSKRLLRIQLTDGLVHVSAVELDGPVRNLSPTTPPGTKVKLVDKVAVQNGFLLLKKTSLEVLGGTVEALYKKWKSQKTGSDNLERGKGDTGPPSFIPFKASGTTSKASGEKITADDRTFQLKKQGNFGDQSKTTEGSRSQKSHESKSSSEVSKNTQKSQGKSKVEERTRSDRAAIKTNQQEREKGDDKFSYKQPSRGARDTVGSKLKDRNGEKELKQQAQSSGYHQGKRSETSFRGRSTGGGENWRNETYGESHYERGRRGRGRGRGRNQTDLEDYEPPSMGNRFQCKFDEPPRAGEDRYHEPHHERGRGRRGRGRRGRRNDDDDTYQPSKPSTGYSLGDWFEQKLVINEKPSYLTKYRDDYYYGDLYYELGEEPYYDSYSYKDSQHSGSQAKKDFIKPEEGYPPMPSKPSSRSTKQPMNRRGQTYNEDRERTTTKETWMNENYPSMPSRPAKKPMSQAQTGQGHEGESHWDWVGLAAGSSAPSSARRRTKNS